MGFRCPNCKTDFNLDREALFKHLADDTNCGREAVKVYSDRLKNSPTTVKENNSQQEFDDTVVVTSKSGTLKSSPKVSPVDTSQSNDYTNKEVKNEDK